MKKLYLGAIIVSVFTLGLYIPKFVAYAQDRAEQRELAKQILDLELELSDVQSEWKVMDDTKLSKQEQIDTLSGEILEIQQEQDNLHQRADEIRKQIDILKGTSTINDEIVNCYEYTGELYNECLDAVVGLMQRRQPQ